MSGVMNRPDANSDIGFASGKFILTDKNALFTLEGQDAHASSVHSQQKSNTPAQQLNTRTLHDIPSEYDLSDDIGFTSMFMDDVDEDAPVDATQGQRTSSPAFNTRGVSTSLRDYAYNPNGLAQQGYTSEAIGSLPLMVMSGNTPAFLGDVLSAAPQVITGGLAVAVLKQSGFVASDFSQARSSAQSVALPAQLHKTAPAKSSVDASPILNAASNISAALTTANMINIPRSRAAAKVLGSMPNIYTPFANAALPGALSLTNTLANNLANTLGTAKSTIPQNSLFSPVDVVSLLPARNAEAPRTTRTLRTAEMPAGYGPWGYVPETRARTTSSEPSTNSIAQYAYQVADFTPSLTPMTASASSNNNKKLSRKEPETTQEDLENISEVALERAAMPLLDLDRDALTDLSKIAGLSETALSEGDLTVVYGDLSTSTDVGSSNEPRTYSLDPATVMKASVQDIASQGFGHTDSGLFKGNIYDLTQVTPANVSASFDVTPGYGQGVRYMH